MDKVTAEMLRQRAWYHLTGPNGAKGYGTYLLGLLLQFAILAVTIGCLFGAFVAMCASLFFALKNGGAAEPTVGVYVVTVIASTILVFGILYCLGFASWSQRAMSIALMRGGLKVSHGVSGWGNGWRMVSLIMWQQTFILFWALLLIVPGIRAAFSYVLAPYLLVDHPDWSPRQCIAESKRMMEGHRWRYFCLNLSFIWWHLLSFVALYVIGNLAQFLLVPYVDSACAAFYEDLLDREDQRIRDAGTFENERQG